MKDNFMEEIKSLLNPEILIGQVINEITDQKELERLCFRLRRMISLRIDQIRDEVSKDRQLELLEEYPEVKKLFKNIGKSFNLIVYKEDETPNCEKMTKSYFLIDKETKIKMMKYRQSLQIQFYSDNIHIVRHSKMYFSASEGEIYLVITEGGEEGIWKVSKIIIEDIIL